MGGCARKRMPMYMAFRSSFGAPTRAYAAHKAGAARAWPRSRCPSCLLANPSLAAVWQQGGGRQPAGARARAAGGGKAKGTAPRGATAGRALAILELVGSRVASWEAAQQLTDALLPLLQPREGGAGRRRGRRGDERLVERTLAVLAALWSRLPSAELAQRPAAQAQLLAVAAALAPLAGSLEERDSR